MFILNYYIMSTLRNSDKDYNMDLLQPISVYLAEEMKTTRCFAQKIGTVQSKSMETSNKLFLRKPTFLHCVES